MSDKNSERDYLVSLLTSNSKKIESESVSRESKKIIAVFVVVAVVVLLFVLFWLFIKGSNGFVLNEDENIKPAIALNENKPISYENEKLKSSLKKSESPVALNAAGFIVARRLATASSEVMGVLTSVDVEEGMYVEKGQVLAVIDSSLLTRDLELAEHEEKLVLLQKQRLGIELEEANKQFQRLFELRKNDMVSQKELEVEQLRQEVLKLRLQEANVQVHLIKTKIKRLQSEMDKYTIRAPFSGVVIGKNAQAGEIVSPSSAGGGFTRTGICTIVDMASLEMEVDVNERFLQRISVNQKVSATLDAYPDWEIEGSVIAIIPSANRSKGTVRVRIKILEPDHRIIPDMSLRVSFGKEVY